MGVAEFFIKLYLCAIIRHIATKFGRPSYDELWDGGVHTDGQANMAISKRLLEQNERIYVVGSANPLSARGKITKSI